MLRQMTAEDPLARPPLAAAATAPFFADDMLLRALRFVESMLQRDAAQKLAFLRDLPTFMRRFDARVLRLRVLPALLEHCRDEAVRAAAVPLVLHLCEGQTPEDFQAHVLPRMRSLFQVGRGLRGCGSRSASRVGACRVGEHGLEVCWLLLCAKVVPLCSHPLDLAPPLKPGSDCSGGAWRAARRGDRGTPQAAGPHAR